MAAMGGETGRLKPHRGFSLPVGAKEASDAKPESGFASLALDVKERQPPTRL